MPPLSASARSTRADLLRTFSWRNIGLAWLIATGRAEAAIASSVVRSPLCDRSITMPTRFISAMTSRPKRVRPESSAS